MKNKSYVAALSVLLISSFAINFCNKIYQCSCFFTTIILAGLFILNQNGKKIAFCSLFTSLMITAFVTYNINYTIGGVHYNGIILTSLFAISASFIIPVLMFENYELSAASKALLIASSSFIIDGFIMSGYFINKLSFVNIYAIFVQEVGCKFIYFSIAYVIYRVILLTKQKIKFIA